ncbi:MAG: ATP-binding protein [Butyrivibrio sp.]|nr:ATP-binding protein [Butyrivibrio sp.]
MQQLKRNEKLIKSKLLQYLLPAIMTNMALQVGNIVDTILVGNILGPLSMSAVQIGGTVLLFIQIPGWMLGIGGSIVAGNCLGKRDTEGAARVFSTCLGATLSSGLLLMLCAAFSDPIAALLTGGEALTEEVAAVTRMTFLGTPVIGVALLMINFMSVDNNPALSTAYVVISNVVNLVADYLLLSYTPIGAAGSTVSTVLGYGIGLVVVLWYIRSPKRMLRLTLSMRGSMPYFLMALTTGVPALLSIICEMIRNSAMNRMVISTVGVNGVTIYTICLNVVMIVELFLGGIVEAMDKIGGVVFGERDYYGIRVLTRYILRYCYGLLAVLMVILFLFARQAASMFGISADPTLLPMAQTALRIFLLALPGYVINRFLISFYQTTEHSGYANLVTILEYCIALLPSVFVCIRIASMAGLDTLNGMMFGLVIGEYLTVCITGLVIRLKHRGEGFLLLPEKEEDVLDFSVGAEISQASMIPREILSFLENRVEKTRANQLAVAAEEMAVNAIRYGGKSLDSIDVMLSVSEGNLILRLRDDGIPFDPTDYTYDGDAYDYSGIDAVRALTDRVTYLRILDFNNTTLEINANRT